MSTNLRQHVAVEERRQDPTLLARRPLKLSVLLMLGVIAVVCFRTFVVEHLCFVMDGGVVYHGN